MNWLIVFPSKIIHIKDLSANARLLLVILYDACKNDRREYYAGVDQQLANALGKKRSSIQRILKELEDHKYIRRETNQTKRGMERKIYLNIDILGG